MSGENIFDQIIDNYHNLSQSEAKIADCVLKQSPDLPYIMISELAKNSQVSESTITRFCRAIGCSSFNDFKLAVAQAYSARESNAQVTNANEDLSGEVQPEDSIEQKGQKLCNTGITALKQTLELLDPAAIRKAVDILTRAENVYCFGQGNSAIVAMEAWGRFIVATPKFHWVSEYHMQLYTAATLGPNDVILYFSFSGAMRELPELGKLICQTGGKLILVTRYPNSPGAAYADLALVCGANETPRQQGSVAVKFGQLLIIDILFQEYCAKNPEEAKKNRERTLNATIPLLL